MQSHVTPSSDCNQAIERWLPVDGYEGLYEVSSFGRVRSLNREDSAGRARKGRILRHALDQGYPYINLCRNGIMQNVRIHKLVAAAFLGPRPNNYTVNHIDSNRTNNSVVNLEYLSLGDNIRHASSLARMGKLNKEQVWEIRETFIGYTTITFAEMAEKFGVTQSTISLVVRAKSYVNLLNRDGSKPEPTNFYRRLKGVDVYALHEAGQSLNSIARQHHVTAGAVSRAYHKVADLMSNPDGQCDGFA